MSRKLQLFLTLGVVITTCAAASYLLAAWLKISTRHGGYRHYGPLEQKARIVLHGSSLAYSGVDWEQISNLGGAIETWPVPGSSPVEWEIQHAECRDTAVAIVVVSAYDLNEHWLCDFRADIVPFHRTLQDLWGCRADWQFCKRIVSQYPMMLVRKLFPTVGRSDGVMTGIRDELRRIAGRSNDVSMIEATKFEVTKPLEFKERVSEWPPSRVQRRLAALRTRCQGQHSFNGPKKMALERLLQQSGHQGEVLLVVLPVSPIYRKEFLNSSTDEELEKMLAEMQAHCPRARLLRLDRLPALANNDLFLDFVHLNYYGQQIATAALLNQLGEHAN